jgi:DNA-binding LacI/PurR family transcriptional regulator
MPHLSMKDIALLAGVSKSTVSRAIRSPLQVKAATRQRIERAMAEHNYVYNVHAADFSRKRTSMLGLIIPTVRSSIYAEEIHGIQEEIQENHLALIIGHDGYNSEKELNLLRLFSQRRLAGTILTGIKPQTIDAVRQVQGNGMPCVVTWETVQDDSISYVGFDNFEAAYKATQYLISMGHERIGLIMGPYSRVERVKQRFEGYRAALGSHNLPFDPELAIETEEPSLLEGKAALAKLLALADSPTAVFAASDVLALGALAAINEHRLRVPEDISLAGFDDIDFAAYCQPPLTTIRVPAREMGRLAVRVLLQMIGKDEMKTHRYCLDTDLVVRKSCGPPPKRQR